MRHKFLHETHLTIMAMGNFQLFSVRCLLYLTDNRRYDLFEIRFFMQFGISCIAFPKLESLIFFPWHNQNVEWSIIALLHFLFSRHFVHFYHVTIRTLAGINLCRKDFVQPWTSPSAIKNWQQGEASSNTWSTVLEVEKETKQEIGIHVNLFSHKWSFSSFFSFSFFSL